MTSHPICGCTRRHALRSLTAGSLLLPGILANLLADEAGSNALVDPLAPKQPHFLPKARRVIFLYMSGGVSHVDTFDPKPRLVADDGKQGPNGFCKAPGWEFQPHGQCGTEVSELFPNLAECVDDIALIRSMRGDHGNHFEATLGIHTGSVTVPRPSLGSWASYGLGTLNRNLPSFVVLAPFLLPDRGVAAQRIDDTNHVVARFLILLALLLVGAARRTLLLCSLQPAYVILAAVATMWTTVGRLLQFLLFVKKILFLHMIFSLQSRVVSLIYRPTPADSENCKSPFRAHRSSENSARSVPRCSGQR